MLVTISRDMLRIPSPYLLFLGNARDELAAKMALSCVRFRPERCIGQLRLADCHADTGLPDLTIAEALEKGVESLVIGVVSSGGEIEDSWAPVLQEALDHGLNIVSGMHQKLEEYKKIQSAAFRDQLIDIRHTSREFHTGTGALRGGKRLLTVGTDCSCGKMFTTLTLERAMRDRGMDVDFRATGQTGILIAGEGVAIDAVVSDFVAGAVENLTPENKDDHWDLIEGQGSLFHPAFAGVTLSLIHGAQSQAIILCHEPTRPHMRGLPDWPLPSLMECIEANERAARLTCPDARVVAVSVNSSALSADEAEKCLKAVSDETGRLAFDPARGGIELVIDLLQ